MNSTTRYPALAQQASTRHLAGGNAGCGGGRRPQAAFPEAGHTAPKARCRWLCAAAVLALAACGGGGGDDAPAGAGGGGSGGAAAGGGTSASVAGQWTVTESGVSNCPGEATYNMTYQIGIAQNGTGLSVTTPAGTFSGTLNGSAGSWSGSYAEDGGTTTITSLAVTVASDNNSFAGTSNWTWRNATSSCSGTTQAFSGTRLGASAGATPTTPAAAAAFSGFDFSLGTGSFWEYRWDFYNRSGSSSGTSTKRDQGRFWVVLGAPTSIDGVNAHAVEILGKSQAKGDRSFAPRWKYLAMSGGRLLGSTDGVTLQTVFDAGTGKWPGGGFFTALDASRLTVAQSARLDNAYLTADAVRAGRSVSTSQCQYFPGIGSICGGSTSQTLIENDYFKGGVGPVGYHYKNSASFSGGGFLSVHNWEHHVGRTASSFEGQSLPFTAEAGAAHAAPGSAQPVAIGAVVRGDAATTDPGFAINVNVSGTVVPISGEDWYVVTVAAPRQLKLTLSFEASPSADLDVYLLTQDARGMTIHARGVLDNPADRHGNETVTFNVPAAGTYYILVDAYATPSGRVPYQLQIE